MRAFLLLILALSLGGIVTAPAADAPPVQLHWLEGTPGLSNGVTWGVPWPKGTLPKDTSFALKTASGEDIPVQSWPLATWPDGSLKWSAHAIGADAGLTEGLTLVAGTSTAPAKPVTVKEDAATITVDTGVMQCVLAKTGQTIIESISRDGKLIAKDGQLVCMSRDQADMPAEGTWTQESFTGEIGSVSVEQRGPVRAVVKIEGKHAGAAGRKWLPFILRLYFYVGGDSVRIMHTIIYDGDANKDFISGLGLRFSVPMKGDLYNRHVRFAGEDHGMWAEAVQGLTGLRRDPGQAVRAAQVAGQAVPPADSWGQERNVDIPSHLALVPAFGDFSLYQATADSFTIRKRTEAGYTWLNSAFGKRSAGLGYVGTPDGGMAFGIRNFWQSYPSGLDIRNAATDTAQVTLWLWSPEASPMDLRFYHGDMGETTFAKQLEGLDITYEDYEPGYATPYGIARTSEMTLWALPATPPAEETAKLADALRTPPQIVARPQDYHAAQVFGGPIWNLADRSTPVKAHIEDQLAWYFDFYNKEIEQRHWYGFWYFGNVMHTYDTDRHVWRYDVGGFAWDNSELSTDLWLWFSFLRTGRPDIYRMAEAMTRNTGEVAVYHIGPFAGLGTRHGVVPWGDSAKQLRISTAENRRFMYYLTADERIGDLLWEEVNADQKLAGVEPGRKLASRAPAGTPAATPTATPDTSPKPYKMTIGVGTDWGSVSAALITAWERSGDTKYRDKLVTSMKSIAALPHGWFSGGGGYDPETGRFFPANNKFDVGHLSIVFGGFEVNAELAQLVDVPEYQHTWLQYCELYNAPEAEQIKALGQSLGKLNLGQGHSRATAYAAYENKSPELAARAWKEFFGAAAGLKMLPEPFSERHIAGPLVLNPVNEIDVSTNAVNQWALAAIECLSLVGDQMPAQEPK